MEIERINDHTVKFYVTYRDIEDRGFDREEIWYNRERSEELFWEMMDEVNNNEDFALEGPLWIQVQALEKGLEIVVTKAQLSKDGQKLELPISNEKSIDFQMDDTIESLVEQANQSEKEVNDLSQGDVGLLDDVLHVLIGFRDFEDLIRLSHSIDANAITSSLYYYEGKYYLYIGFNEGNLEEEIEDDLICQMLEFGFESRLSIYRIREYGKEIMTDHALQQVKQHFPLS